ncbi:hypothetical protein DFQ28_011092 [Apophysomyces sp. BC1034]|nr:hypothetical protein DFQ28_011092 [Apophysomyces sp. BC1034]
MTAFECPVIHANNGRVRWHRDLLLAVAFEQTKNRFAADRNAEPLRQACTRGATKRQAHMPQHRLRSGCATLLTRAEWRKAFGECSPATRCVIATKAPDMYFQRYAMAATRQVLNASSVPSVYPRTRRSASRAAELERADQAQHIIPMRRDAIKVHALPRERVEVAIIRLGIDAPETRATDISQARAEAIVGEAEQARTPKWNKPKPDELLALALEKAPSIA